MSVGGPSPITREFAPELPDDGPWIRQFEVAGIIAKSYCVMHPHDKGLPASMSLPPDMRLGEVVNRSGHTYRQHKDGSKSTLDGRRIIDNKRAEKNACSETGYSAEEK